MKQHIFMHAKKKFTDLHVNPCNLICAFAVHFLESIGIVNFDSCKIKIL